MPSGVERHTDTRQLGLRPERREVTIDELEIRRDVRERIVDLVRDAARHRPDRCEAIAEEQLRLEHLLVGHVLRRSDQRLRTPVVALDDDDAATVQPPDRPVSERDAVIELERPVGGDGRIDVLEDTIAIVWMYRLGEEVDGRLDALGERKDPAELARPRERVRLERPLPAPDAGDLLHRAEETKA